MLARRIAVVDVATDAAQAFRSMLEVLNGRTRCRWQLVDSIDDANVVVTDGRRALPESHRHVVAVIESCDVRPRTPYVLTHPFRVMQVLSILDDIADDVHARLGLGDAAGPEPDRWDFARSVRALGNAREVVAGYRAQTSGGRVIQVAADLRAYACEPDLVEAIRSGHAVFTALAPLKVRHTSPNAVRRPASELFWHNALHADTRLAPWLDGAASFRIRRWPDFGLIPVQRAQLQIVAALARQPRTRAELARLVPTARTEVDRVLNAVSLCGLLDQSGAAVEREHAASPPGFLRSLISGLRDRIGRNR